MAPGGTFTRAPVGVLQLIDSLALGGAERVAVNLANQLPRARYQAYLGTTRAEGPLAEAVAADVTRLALRRRHTLDLLALRPLISLLRIRRIQIIHAHSSTLFVAALASCLPPFPRIVWHIHFGRYASGEGATTRYKFLATQADAVIAVNQPLATWSVQKLAIPCHKVHYIPNFSSFMESLPYTKPLPGKSEQRIICVANLRAEKDQVNLLRAMALVVRSVPTTHLIMVGAASDPQYQELIQHEITQLDLGQHVTWLGQRQDADAIMCACSIGVLSSASEGLPLALLEYGAAGLAVVATRVGQCAEVLDEGRAGLLVPPGEPRLLAAALVTLLQSGELRRRLGARLQAHIQAHYSPKAVISQVEQVYAQVLQQ